MSRQMRLFWLRPRFAFGKALVPVLLLVIIALQLAILAGQNESRISTTDLEAAVDDFFLAGQSPLPQVNGGAAADSNVLTAAETPVLEALVAENYATGDVATISFGGGRPAVVLVWAPWCPHCQEEIPELDRLLRTGEIDSSVNLVTVATNFTDSELQSFVREHDLSIPILLDSDGSIASRLGAFGIPTWLFVDATGEVFNRQTGRFASRVDMSAAIALVAEQ